ncbi:hypothetical protein DPMN_180592 [Dreissena polymorpha]|uniref:Uncharacterized protein n=1 Tax=Dreissena polymorpha TaxID=45954 RepID=A0A9D4EGX6_DREPO|nr:hypothetical protein DPMN_180592 [Dreissena polymorpha]
MPALQLTVSCTTSDNVGLTTDRTLHSYRAPQMVAPSYYDSLSHCSSRRLLPGLRHRPCHLSTCHCLSPHYYTASLRESNKPVADNHKSTEITRWISSVHEPFLNKSEMAHRLHHNSPQ